MRALDAGVLEHDRATACGDDQTNQEFAGIGEEGNHGEMISKVLAARRRTAEGNIRAAFATRNGRKIRFTRTKVKEL